MLERNIDRIVDSWPPSSYTLYDTVLFELSEATDWCPELTGLLRGLNILSS